MIEFTLCKILQQEIYDCRWNLVLAKLKQKSNQRCRFVWTLAIMNDLFFRLRKGAKSGKPPLETGT